MSSYNKKIIAGFVILTVIVLGFSIWFCTERQTSNPLEDTVKGYLTAYNAEDFTTCLTYFTDYGDEEEALAFLSYMRNLSGPLEFRETKGIAIIPPVAPGSGQTATVTVVFTIGGEEGTDQLQLKEVNGKWKIIWEQEATTGESAAIEDAGEVAAILPGSVEIAPEFQGTLQVEHRLWMGEDGQLRVTYLVRNIGDPPTTHLVAICEIYNAEGELLIYLNPSGILGPGEGMGVRDLWNPQDHTDIPIQSAAYYKIVVKSE